MHEVVDGSARGLLAIPSARWDARRSRGCWLPAYRALVATALYTGVRLSELLGWSGMTSI